MLSLLPPPGARLSRLSVAVSGVVSAIRCPPPVQRGPVLFRFHVGGCCCRWSWCVRLCAPPCALLFGPRVSAVRRPFPPCFIYFLILALYRACAALQPPCDSRRERSGNEPDLQLGQTWAHTCNLGSSSVQANSEPNAETALYTGSQCELSSGRVGVCLFQSGFSVGDRGGFYFLFAIRIAYLIECAPRILRYIKGA